MAAIIACIIGIMACVFATDELEKVYFIHKYNIDIYLEVGIQPDELITRKDKVKLIFSIIGIIIYMIIVALICFGVSQAMMEQK